MAAIGRHTVAPRRFTSRVFLDPRTKPYSCFVPNERLRIRHDVAHGAAWQAVYCLRPEQQPIFVFCVDVSPRALETGFTAACLAAVEESLDTVPGGGRARVGVMTFDKCLQVYRFDEEGNVSQMAVAADTEVGDGVE